MATTVNDRMHSGDTLVATIPIVDDAGAAVDLAGAAATYRIADNALGTVHVTKTSGTGIALGAGGVATLTLDPADTAELAGVYYHELEVVDSAGNVNTVLAGTLEIEGEVI